MTKNHFEWDVILILLERRILMDDNDFMNDEEIFSKVTEIMNKLQQNQELQDLSERNGLDVKNSIRLNKETQDNIAIAVVSLLLAKKSNDPKYRKLTQMGLQKRHMKTEIINDYKASANQLIQKYRQSKSV